MKPLRKGGKCLFVDNDFLSRFGLDAEVDKVTEFLLEFDRNHYASIDNWRSGFDFERRLCNSSKLGRKGVKGDIAWAVTKTLSTSAKFNELADYLTGYHRIVSVRVGPVVMVMLAWLNVYQLNMDRYRAAASDLLKRKNHPSLSTELQLCLKTVTDDEKKTYLADLHRWKTKRSLDLLNTTFDLGFNDNLMSGEFTENFKDKSTLLYTFDKRKAEWLVQNGVSEDYFAGYKFNQSGTGQLHINDVDYCNPEICGIVFGMINNSKLITRLQVARDNGTALKLNKKFFTEIRDSLNKGKAGEQSRPTENRPIQLVQPA